MGLAALKLGDEPLMTEFQIKAQRKRALELLDEIKSGEYTPVVDETLFQLHSDDEVVILHIGFYVGSEFIGMLVENGDEGVGWDVPLQQITTKDVNQFRQWVGQMIDRFL